MFGGQVSSSHISAAILEGARGGGSVTEQLIPGIPVEATFPDSTKLVAVHHPIP